MLHILPEIEHGLEKAQAKLEIEWLAELVVCAGFFLVYLVEELAHMLLHKTPHKEHLHKTFSLRKPRERSNSQCNPGKNETEMNGDVHNDMELGHNTSPHTLEVPTKDHPAADRSQSVGHSHIPVGSQISSMRDFLTSKHCIFDQ